MTLEELGALLRERREGRGLAAADVAARLNILESRILALEAGDYSDMPHATYAKGFLRTYAGFVGLNPDDPAIAEACASIAPKDEGPGLHPIEPDRTARPRRDTRWVGIVLSLGIFGLICLGIWRLGLVDFVRDKARDMQTPSPMQAKDPLENMPKAPAPAPAPAVPPKEAQPAPDPAPVNPNMPSRPEPMHSPAQINPSMPAGAGSSTSAGSPTNPANPNLAGPAPVRQPLQGTVPAGSPWGTLQGNATLAGQAGLASGQQEGQRQVNPNMPPGAPALGAPSDADLQALPGQHKIVISAEETCWMQATPDGGKAQQHTMKAGETLTFPFTAKLVLRLGNAGGVRIWYDGQEMGDRGRPGQVRTMTFPPVAAQSQP